MADDLMDFSVTEDKENCYIGDKDENVPPCPAPSLVQSPVIVNSILKQCTKDNLIQLYTPVQKPVKGKLKVRFGSDSLLETPVVKTEKGRGKVEEDIQEQAEVKSEEAIKEQTEPKAEEAIKKQAEVQVEKAVKEEAETMKTADTRQVTEEEEEWIERTSVLTKHDHDEYGQMAGDILQQLIADLPIKEEVESSTVEPEGDVSMMDVSEYEATATTDKPPAQTVENEVPNMSVLDKLLLEAAACLQDTHYDESSRAKADNEKSNDKDISKDTQESTKPTESESNEIEKGNSPDTAATADIIPCSEEEQMDCEEAMEVDEEPGTPPAIEVKTEPDKVVKYDEEVTIKGEIGSPEQTSEDKCVDEKTGSVCSAEEKPIEINTENKAAADKEIVETVKIPEKREEIQVTEVESQNEVKLDEQFKETQLTDRQTSSEEDHAPQARVKDDSSDEEFMSADEDVENTRSKGQTITTETKTDISQQNAASVADSPERIPPKVGYSIDFDDMEMMNPFAIKSGLVNSPDVGKIKIQNDVKQEEEKRSKEMTKLASVENTEVKKVEEIQDEQESVKPEKESPVEETAESTNVPASDSVSSSIQENTPASVETEQPESPERIPPKVGYSINFDDLDMVDPFASNTGLMNSPDVGKSLSNDTMANDIKKEVRKEENTNSDQPVTKDHEKVEENKDDKFHSANASPEKNGTRSTEKKSLQNSDQGPEEDGNTCTSKGNVEVKNSLFDENPTEVLDIDPFKPKIHLMNSPDKIIDDRTVTANADNSVIEGNFTEQQTLTENKGKLENKDGKQNEEVEMTKQSVKKQKQTSVKKKTEKPETIEVSPENVDDEISVPKGTYNFDDIDFDSSDPFKPKKQMMNSPDMNYVKTEESKEEVKNQHLNSVAPESRRDISKDMETIDTSKAVDCVNVSENVNSETTNTDAVGLIDDKPLPEIEDIDPFKPRKQMQNSPVANIKDIGSDLEKLDESEQFNPSKQIGNSPADQKKFSPTDVLPEDMDTNDVFTDAVDNIVLDNIDPFKSKSKITNTPEGKNKPHDVSLDAFEDLDPFKTKRKVADTQEKTTDDNKKNNIGDVDFEALDPFKPTKQMANSPASDPFATKFKIPQSPQADKGQITALEERQCRHWSDNRSDMSNTADLADNVFEIQGVTRRGDQPQGATIQPFGSCNDFDEAQFVPATEVFSKPGVWEMLEQLGSQDSEKKEESSLSRMSLYVKFDPLVDAAPTNPRRISIKPCQLEKVKEYGLDETLLLLGTPPKRRRQSMNFSHMRNTPTGERLKAKPTIALATEAPGGGVDLILEYSPNRETAEDKKEVPTKKLFPSGLSLMTEPEQAESDTNLFQELKYTDSDLGKLRSEMQLQLQGLMLAKQATWTKEKEEVEKALRAAKNETKALEGEKEKMVEVCVMFESTIKELAEKKEVADKKTEKMKEERDQALQDTLAVENAFSDLHRRYEKMKNVLATMMQNEEVLKKSVAELLEKKKTMDANFQSLKKQAEEKTSRYSQEIQRLQKQMDEEKGSMEAKNKLLQMQLDGMEKTIQQKIEENKQLTEICENLISKYEK